MLKLITIRNDTKIPVIRANLLFPGAGIVRFVMDPTISKFKEIKACSSLRLVSIEELPAEYFEQSPVFKVEADKSVVVAPEVAVKVVEEESFVYADDPVHVDVVEPPVVPVPPVVEPPVDTTPVVVAPEEPLPDVTELEVVETDDKEEIVVAISCPYCDFASASKTGLFHHVRVKHPDNYAEYKERLKNM